MKKRSVPVVIIASLLTLGIYAIVWYVITRNEMRDKGIETPHPLLLLIPFIGAFLFIWFLWAYSGGVEKVTNGKFSQVIAFVLLFLLGFIGIAVIQNAYNEIGENSGGGSNPFGN